MGQSLSPRRSARKSSRMRSRWSEQPSRRSSAREERSSSSAREHKLSRSARPALWSGMKAWANPVLFRRRRRGKRRRRRRRRKQLSRRLRSSRGPGLSAQTSSRTVHVKASSGWERAKCHRAVSFMVPPRRGFIPMIHRQSCMIVPRHSSLHSQLSWMLMHCACMHLRLYWGSGMWGQRRAMERPDQLRRKSALWQLCLRRRCSSRTGQALRVQTNIESRTPSRHGGHSFIHSVSQSFIPSFIPSFIHFYLIGIYFFNSWPHTKPLWRLPKASGESRIIRAAAASKC